MMSNSNSSSPSTTASKESLVQNTASGSTTPSYSPYPASKPCRPSPLSQSSRSCQSVDNLLALSPLLLTPTRRGLRAMSHCEGIRANADEQGVTSLNRDNRFKEAKGSRHSSISPMKRLRRFLRTTSKKRVSSDGSIEESERSSGIEPSFPILDLSEEPWRPRDFSATTPDYPSHSTVPGTIFQMPIVSLSRDESIHASDLTSEYPIRDRQSKARLSVPSVSSGYISESPTRSGSPSSITTPTFQHQFSAESAVLSDPLDQGDYCDHLQPRKRSHSAPNKIIHDIQRLGNNTNYDSLPRRKKLASVTTGGIISLPYRPNSDNYPETVSPSTSSNPSRVTSPSSGSRRTSDYFSDVTSFSGPSSPPSMMGSEFTSQESVCTIVSQPGQSSQQRQYKPPLRAHSLTYRSRYATHASPLVKSHISQSHSSHFY